MDANPHKFEQPDVPLVNSPSAAEAAKRSPSSIKYVWWVYTVAALGAGAYTLFAHDGRALFFTIGAGIFFAAIALVFNEAAKEIGKKEKSGFRKWALILIVIIPAVAFAISIILLVASVFTNHPLKLAYLIDGPSVMQRRVDEEVKKALCANNFAINFESISGAGSDRGLSAFLRVASLDKNGVEIEEASREHELKFDPTGAISAATKTIHMKSNTPVTSVRVTFSIYQAISGDSKPRTALPNRAGPPGFVSFQGDEPLNGTANRGYNNGDDCSPVANFSVVRENVPKP